MKSQKLVPAEKMMEKHEAISVIKTCLSVNTIHRGSYLIHEWSFHIKFIKTPSASFINFIRNDHECKILFII